MCCGFYIEREIVGNSLHALETILPGRAKGCSCPVGQAADLLQLLSQCRVMQQATRRSFGRIFRGRRQDTDPKAAADLPQGAGKLRRGCHDPPPSSTDFALGRTKIGDPLGTSWALEGRPAAQSRFPVPPVAKQDCVRDVGDLTFGQRSEKTIGLARTSGRPLCVARLHEAPKLGCCSKRPGPIGRSSYGTIWLVERQVLGRLERVVAVVSG